MPFSSKILYAKCDCKTPIGLKEDGHTQAHRLNEKGVPQFPNPRNLTYKGPFTAIESYVGITRIMIFGFSETVRENYLTRMSTDADVEKEIKKWLRFASDRIMRKEKRLSSRGPALEERNA